MAMQRHWQPIPALRDFVEILLVVAFAIVVPSLVEQVLIAHGFGTTGTERIVGTGLIFVCWAIMAFVLLVLNGEGFAVVGLAKPANVPATISYGLLTAAGMFVTVVTLEHMGYGRDRLGDMATELQNNPALVVQRMALSVFVVGFVEEFIFRGFILTRLVNIFGGSATAWMLAIGGQAVLFGLSHGYQSTYGMVLTGGIGLFLGLIFGYGGRNLWIPIIGHGIYDAAHAFFLSGLIGHMV